jgi:hypothetical protein
MSLPHTPAAFFTWSRLRYVVRTWISACDTPLWRLRAAHVGSRAIAGDDRAQVRRVQRRRDGTRHAERVGEHGFGLHIGVDRLGRSDAARLAGRDTLAGRGARTPGG